MDFNQRQRLPNRRASITFDIESSTTSRSSGFADFLLGHLRIGVRRSRLFENEILATGISLKAGLLDPDHAVAHLAEIGALSLCGLSS